MINQKIDFVLLVSVNNANPNGDPLNGNRPRADFNGFGEISDVCIKRKIRNRMQDLGGKVFVQSNDRCDDGCDSLSKRAEPLSKITDKEEYATKACENWIDVRTFGQVFAFKGNKLSVGVRGPVSIHQAVSVSPVEINSMQITKSVNSESKDGKASDTMGSKHFVRFGFYKIKGSINVQLSEKTGLDSKDVEVIKECLRTLFVNDSSSARPDGSMEVYKLYWWEHNSMAGQYSSAKVHKLVEVKEKVEFPTSTEDYEITVNSLDGLKLIEIDGI